MCRLGPLAPLQPAMHVRSATRREFEHFRDVHHDMQHVHVISIWITNLRKTMGPANRLT